MYESFFGLTAKPFQLNPDPRFFFRSTGHKRALAYMRYGLQQEQGFIVVTGDVGTGKTMLVNNLFSELDTERLVAVKIVSTNVKDIDLLRLIAAEFDLPFESASKAVLLNSLENYFTTCRQEGKRVLLVVDEAQNLSRSALEELRMLSNFEYKGAPLVQSFLLGQREFRAVLRAAGLEQLRQRVIAAYHLKPLSVAEIRAYIEHRLYTVGWTGDPEVEVPVYEIIYQATGGVPRRINTLFDRVLLNAYLEEQHTVTTEMARAVCEEVEVEMQEDDDALEEAIQTSTSRPIMEHHASREGGPAKQENMERLESRIREMQATIDSLSSGLRFRDSEAVSQPNEHSIGPSDATLSLVQKFPLWTAVFLSLVGVLVLGGVVGFWLFMS